MSNYPPHQRSSAVGIFAAIACVLLAVVLLIGGVIVAGLFFIQRAVNQEFENISAEIAAIDQSYIEETGAIPAIVLTEAFASDSGQAQITFGGQSIMIDGFVAEINVANSTLSLGEPNSHETGTANVVVQLAAGELEVLNDLGLSAGDFVSVQGQVEGYIDGVVKVQDGRVVVDY